MMNDMTGRCYIEVNDPKCETNDRCSPVSLSRPAELRATIDAIYWNNIRFPRQGSFQNELKTLSLDVGCKSTIREIDALGLKL